jgi:hypothetical protein
MLFFWDLAPYRLVGRGHLFGETYCLHLQGWRWKQYVSPKRWPVSIFGAQEGDGMFLRNVGHHPLCRENLKIFFLCSSSVVNLVRLCRVPDDEPSSAGFYSLIITVTERLCVIGWRCALELKSNGDVRCDYVGQDVRLSTDNCFEEKCLFKELYEK